ncbi:MarR family winged helix-turn-helix transcriptional regulator [Bacillus suaedaesalsae]|uniref:Winged helix-turn-helix transcriptional regulator n=1 Tax=Bacillus suaedaesalsae TaxID=2810349 RepID=A0ABS2DKJ9_9BACI|nr:MarR family winged helix-turn-helix transcriptional regulator [Bacillus suaedaesalsae]MBM6618931.1 winged helix-turn-helix transcriptional regulator [Bacillus suaedaesalsae]
MDYKKYKLDESLGYKLFHASRLITNRLNQNFRKDGLPVTHEQWQVLFRLYEEDGLTQQKLSIINEKDQPSTSRLIDNMIKRDLVKRVSHPTDGRTNIIYLTDASKDMMNSLLFNASKTVSEASIGITNQDMATCLRVLDKIRKNLS